VSQSLKSSRTTNLKWKCTRCLPSMLTGEAIWPIVWLNNHQQDFWRSMSIFKPREHSRLKAFLQLLLQRREKLIIPITLLTNSHFQCNQMILMQLPTNNTGWDRPLKTQALSTLLMQAVSPCFFPFSFDTVWNSNSSLTDNKCPLYPNKCQGSLSSIHLLSSSNSFSRYPSNISTKEIALPMCSKSPWTLTPNPHSKTWEFSNSSNSWSSSRWWEFHSNFIIHSHSNINIQIRDCLIPCLQILETNRCLKYNTHGHILNNRFLISNYQCNKWEAVKVFSTYNTNSSNKSNNNYLCNNNSER
jgi:hypothetical protein